MQVESPEIQMPHSVSTHLTHDVNDVTAETIQDLTHEVTDFTTEIIEQIDAIELRLSNLNNYLQKMKHCIKKNEK